MVAMDPSESEVVVVSNRGAIAMSMASGVPRPTKTGGGLASALAPALASGEITWVANPMSAADRLATDEHGRLRDGERLVHLTDVDATTLDVGTGRVANESLWFIHHDMGDLAIAVDDEEWTAFLDLQVAVADRVADVAPANAIVLVQDYHLPLIAGHLSSTRPDLTCVHFSHTPFASPASLRRIGAERARVLLDGMAAHRACGFHSRRWEAHFRQSCESFDIATPATFVAPIPPDLASVAITARSEGVRQIIETNRARVGHLRRIVRVDRLEPTKNILTGFDAYDRLLDGRPDLVGRVVMQAFAYPSRSSLAVYRTLAEDVARRAAQLNDRWATRQWTPLELDLTDDLDRAIAALVDHDVLLVNPIADGLNLVAFEGPAVSERSGALVLSRTAGAHDLLADVVDSIDPHDVKGTAEALGAALDRPVGERAVRRDAAATIAGARDIDDWLRDQITAANNAAPRSH